MQVENQQSSSLKTLNTTLAHLLHWNQLEQI